MKRRKHIAMWACPRSRSTVTTRAFENLDGCILYDEPFLDAYRYIRKEIFDWDEVVRSAQLSQRKLDTDYKHVIDVITGDLPPGKTFSFQKLATDEYLPIFGTDWILKLYNFFLIRHPKDILLSLDRVLSKKTVYKYKEITEEMVGIEMLHYVFKFVSTSTGKIPLVVHSDDIVKNPKVMLSGICNYFGLTFEDSMLSWDKNLDNSVISKSMIPANSDPWYEALRESKSFIPYQDNKAELPERFKPILDKSMLFYDEMIAHCNRFEM